MNPMLAIFYYSTCYALCFAGLIAILLRFWQTHDRADWWLLVVFCAFSMVTMSQSLGFQWISITSGSPSINIVLNCLGLLSIPLFLIAVPCFVGCFGSHRGQKTLFRIFRVTALTSLGMPIVQFLPDHAGFFWWFFLFHVTILALAGAYALVRLRQIIIAPPSGSRRIARHWSLFLPLLFWLLVILFPLGLLNDLLFPQFQYWRIGLPRIMPLLSASLSIGYVVTLFRSIEAKVPILSVASCEQPRDDRASSEYDWESLGLSAREREVAALLVAGHSYKKIAEFLFVSPGTIKTHVLNIYSKTDTRNKLELLHKARRPSPG